MRKKRIAIVLVVCVLFSLITGSGCAAISRTERRHLHLIVSVAEKNYSKYHILPSVAAGQARQESGWGTTNRGNWFGIKGFRSYDGKTNILRYLRLIRYSGYYGNAWQYKDAYRQLHAIQSRGYCDPADDPHYETQVKSIIRRYNLIKYDKRLFARLKKKRLKKRLKMYRRGKFKFVYDNKMPENELKIDKRVVKGGSVLVRYSFYDVQPTHRHLKDTIITGDKTLAGDSCKLKGIFENAKG